MTHHHDDGWLRGEPDSVTPEESERRQPLDDGWLRHDPVDPEPGGAEARRRSYAGRPAYEPTPGEPRTDGSPRGKPGRPSGRHARSAPPRKRPGGVAVLGAAVKEFFIVIAMALVLSFVVKTWLLQAFYIPSGSMEDTLVLNDRVIVSKLTPGPVDLKRGDIVVFADPGDWLSPQPEVERGRVSTVVRDALTFVGLLPDTSENHLIKRVIGLPGDHVVCCDAGQRITVNGAPIAETYVKEGNPASDCSFDIVVPAGRVWVMGDHRNNSADSRPHDVDGDGTRGSVDERLIVGRAVALVWPLNHLAWLSNPEASFRNVPPAATGTQQPGAGAEAATSGSAAAQKGERSSAQAATPAAAGLQDLRPCVGEED